MTGLQKTELTLSQKVQCAVQSLSRQAQGAITALSLEFGLSRPTIYEVAATAQAVLNDHFESYPERRVCVTIDEAQLRRAVVALRVVAPNSIRAIEELIPLLYPGHRLSYGKLHQWLSEAEQQAEQFTRQCDLSAIKAAALDEMFSQRQPVLAGIDLDSGYLFSLALRRHRSGEDWAAVLQAGEEQQLRLQVVVKDAAKGIAAGVSEVFPEAEQRDDCFHAYYEMNKIRRRLEQRAYKTIEEEHTLEEQLGRVSGRSQRRSHRHKQAWARRKCQQAISEFDTFERAADQVRSAMSWINLDTGQLRTAEQVINELCQAADTLRQLGAQGCAKLATYLTNRAPGLAAYVAELHTQLQTLITDYGEQAVSLAGLITQLHHDLDRPRSVYQQREHTLHLLGAYQQLRQQLGTQADPLIDHLQQLWQQRYRASSAIEGFNASLRPYLYVHKRVSQGFLNLYQAYFNLRTRRWGRHQGTSAQQCLTGQPVEDWLTLIGYPPSATTQ